MSDQRIVWEMPDGTIRVTTPAKGKDLDQVAARVKQADPEMKDAVRLSDIHASELPDRSKRYAWRRNPVNGKIRVDLSIPEPVIEPTIEERLTALEAKTP